MKATQDFFEILKTKLSDLEQTQSNNIETAAEWIAQTYINKGNFYIFGSGHSHMVAEEMYIRAGGLSFVQAILPPEMMLHQMLHKSTNLERLTGYAKAILDLYPVTDQDTMIVISNSGRNASSIEMCQEAQRRGAKVIAITSLKHSSQVEARHDGKKRLFELADLVIDNQAELGDAAYLVDGAPVKAGGTSDFIGIAIAQLLTVTIIEKLVEKGIEPPILMSANVGK